jgi:L-alanine-DL-glutamate epimerase-like enolase superfamily enzyme
VLAETQEVKDGAMRLPAGPGLGVMLDRAKIEKLTLESAEVRA